MHRQLPPAAEADLPNIINQMTVMHAAALSIPTPLIKQCVPALSSSQRTWLRSHTLDDISGPPQEPEPDAGDFILDIARTALITGCTTYFKKMLPTNTETATSAACNERDSADRSTQDKKEQQTPSSATGGKLAPDLKQPSNSTPSRSTSEATSTQTTADKKALTTVNASLALRNATLENIPGANHPLAKRTMSALSGAASFLTNLLKYKGKNNTEMLTRASVDTGLELSLFTRLAAASPFGAIFTIIGEMASTSEAQDFLDKLSYSLDEPDANIPPIARGEITAARRQVESLKGLGQLFRSINKAKQATGDAAVNIITNQP